MLLDDPAVRPTLPPGPPLSATQQTLRWLARPYQFLRQCAEQLGDAFTLDFGSHGAYVLFSRPETIRAIFLGDTAQLHASAGNAILRPLLGPNSLLLLEEQHHLDERRTLLRAFHGTPLGDHGPLLRALTLDAVRDWTPGQSVVIQDVGQGIALEVIWQIVFGPDAGEQTGALKRQLRSLLNDPRLNLALFGQLRSDPGLTAAWPAFRQQLEHLDRHLYAEIDRRRQSGRADGGVLNTLLAVGDEEGSPLSDSTLRDEVLTLLITGYETTATALAWAFSWVHREPEVLCRLREELASVGSEPAALTRLAYLDAVCKETLRIQPVVPLVARLTRRQPLHLQGYAIPAGVTVAPCIYLTHHREDLYHRPDAFRPERFLDREYSPYEFLPFGGGVRRCLGMSLALYEMKVVLGLILQRFDLHPAVGETVRPVRRVVTIGPSGGTRLTVTRARAHPWT